MIVSEKKLKFDFTQYLTRFTTTALKNEYLSYQIMAFLLALTKLLYKLRYVYNRSFRLKIRKIPLLCLF